MASWKCGSSTCPTHSSKEHVCGTGVWNCSKRTPMCPGHSKKSDECSGGSRWTCGAVGCPWHASSTAICKDATWTCGRATPPCPGHSRRTDYCLETDPIDLDSYFKNHSQFATPWKLVSSAGGEGGVKFIGGAKGLLYLKWSNDETEYRLSYNCFGVSAGPMPASFTGSLKSFKSWPLGSVHRLPFTSSLKFADFAGGCVMITGGAAKDGLGGSASVVFMGAPSIAAAAFLSPVTLLAAMATCKAVGIVYGGVVGVSLGLGLYSGYIQLA